MTVNATSLRLLGANHADTAEVQLDLGDALRALGRDSDAHAAYARSLAAFSAIAQTPPARLAELRARLAAVSPSAAR